MSLSCPAGKGWVPDSFPVCVTPHCSPAASPSQGGWGGQLPSHWHRWHSPDLQQEEWRNIWAGQIYPLLRSEQPQSPLQGFLSHWPLGLWGGHIPKVPWKSLSPPAGFAGRGKGGARHPELPPTGCAGSATRSHQASGDRCLLELSQDDNRGRRLPALPHRWAEAGLPSKQSVHVPQPAGITKLRAGIVFPVSEGVDTRQD